MLRELKENFEAEKARLRGEARSQARLVKLPRDIEGLMPSEPRPAGPAQAIAGAFVRMKDGSTMQAWSDGSWRYAVGKPLAKAAKKRAKKLRRRHGRTA